MIILKQIMDRLLKRCVRKNREAIILDLNPKYIIESLVKNNVVTKEECNRVMNKSTREKQTVSLLGILMMKSSGDFEYFLQALEENSNYPWLAESMRNFMNNNSNEEKPDLYEKLLEGGVPFQINNLLPRDKELRSIRKAICDVCTFRRGWIVICGMVGSGKSVLAAEAVRDNEMFHKCFSGGIFWIPIGKLDDSALRMKMHHLCTFIDPDEHNQPATVELINRLLKLLVAKCIRDKRQILLVLDDVWDKNVIKAFDIGCPAIITTRNKDILDGISGRNEYIRLDEGLQLEETKELLSLHLDIAVDDLPHDEIKTIHERCKGSPIVIAMIGSMMRTYGNKIDRWKKYRKQLEEGRAGRFRHSSNDSRNLFQAIDISVKSLSEEMQGYYELFAAFKEDNNIPNQVLEIQWDKDKDEVEDIMSEFERKSLARVTEGIDDTFMYSIHDLHLDYLKEKCKDKKCLHKNFVQQYIKKCSLNNDATSYDYGLLPDDKYIHYFLAYHLYMAEEYDMFAKIFLDMSFVEKKLKIAGPSDLLNDYKIYDNCFSKEQEKEKSDYEKFIRNNASLMNKEDIDIIQLALCEPPDSVVYSKAKSIALKREKPYFLWCNISSIRKCILLNTRPHDGSVHCAVFGPGGNIAASVGKDQIVRIWDCAYGTLLHEFYGHSDEIKCCVFSQSGNFLLTASLDKTVKEWSIPSYTSASTSERRRSSVWLPPENSTDQSCETYNGHKSGVLCCSVSSDNTLIASGADDGIGIVWQREHAVILYRLIGHSSAINCCTFSSDDMYIATASSDYSVMLWNASDGHWMKIMLHGTDIVSSCQFDKKGKYLISSAGGFVWRWKLEDNITPEDKYNSIKSSYLINCCVFSPDQKHIAGGTSGNSVFVWSIAKHAVVACFKAHSDSIKCVSYSNDGNKILSTAENGTLIVWDITKFLGFSHVSLSKHISVVFCDNELTIATPDETNCIQILTGLKGQVNTTFMTENRDGDISICCLSPNCTKVAYGTNIGVVKLFYIKSKEVREFSGHAGEVNFITFSPDSSAFATCSTDCEIKIWRESEAEVTCKGHSDATIRCKFFSSGRKLLSCSKDGSLKIWNTADGTLLMNCCGHGRNTVAYCSVSRNEMYFASAGVDNKVILWDAKSGNEINCLTSTDCMRCCCFAPNNQYLAAGDDGGRVQVWNISKHTSTAIILVGHDHWVQKITFSPDSMYLVSVASSIKWWSIEGKLLQTFDDGGDKYHIFANQDFSTFVTVDIAGTLYILKTLKTLLWQP